MFAIRKDFKCEYAWKEAQEIQKEIDNTPVGKHITLFELLPSGIRLVKYVTVGENGVLHDAYTNQVVSIKQS